MPVPSAQAGLARPFLKWAGGKTQLLAAFEKLYPRGKVRRYHEPFLGGGAVFFHVQARLRPGSAVLSDNNADLIETFTAVRDGVDQVIERLRLHRKEHDERHFYAMRAADPSDPVERAARIIYLNKTCFNGLYRVNSRGIFNVPFGRYKKPAILDEPALRAASLQLRKAELRTAPFTRVLEDAEPGDFVYFDPPYHPVSKTADFTSYTRASFGERDQEELARVYAELAERGCLVMLSNSDTPFVRRLYRGRFTIRSVRARRSINSRPDRRGPVREVVVLNYQPRGG